MTTTCDPATVISQEDITRLKADIELIDEVVESPLLTAVTPRGKVTDTLTGRLTKLGYLPPIDYAAGIVFSLSDNIKTIDRNGIIYAPKPSALPFDTTGTWTGVDADKFFVIQSVQLYGGQIIIPYDSVAEMASDASLMEGIYTATTGYFTAGDNGGSFYIIVAAGTGVADGGRFIDLGASGLQAQALFPEGQFFAPQFGVVGNGDESVAMQNAIDAAGLYGGSTIVLPVPTTGAYTFNVRVDNEIAIEGTSRQVTVNAATDKAIFTLDPTLNIDSFQVRNLTIDGSPNKGAFVSQDGIVSNPDAGIVHAGIVLDNVRITDCGKRGLSLIGGATVGETERVRNISLINTVIENCVDSGVYMRGNVGLFSMVNGSVRNNGNEAVKLQSNVVAVQDSPGFPEALSFQSVQFDTSLYTVQGNVFYLSGVLSFDVGGCVFTEFHTAFDIDTGPNGQFSIRDCRFDRPLGPITELARVLAVNGFVWDNNDVDAATTGPVGINLIGTVDDLIKMDIRGNNSWGSLDVSTDDFPAVLVAANQINLPRRFGTIPVTLPGDGVTDLNNIFDEKGGVAQLVSGDQIVLYTSTQNRDVVVKSAVGNIRLAGNADFALDDARSTLTLVWNQFFGDWVEISRSTNRA